MNTEPAIVVDDLTITINRVNVVSGIDFSLDASQTLALVGESGCGKSLTALAIMGLLPEAAHLSRGSIRLNGKDLTRLSEREMRSIRGKDVSMIFQEPGSTLDPLMTVGKQIFEAVHAHRRISNQQAQKLVIGMLEKVGIPEAEARFKNYPFELSGGMCQRIMIATALICNPAVLIADEPTTALDVTIQAQTLDLMRKLKDETGTAILLITHDMGVVADMADRVMVMYAGQVVEDGDVFEIFKHPRHPYTRLLLQSIPHLERNQKARLQVIDGFVPDMNHWPDGCRFHPRCPLADEICRISTPSAESAENDRHSVACWHHSLEIP